MIKTVIVDMEKKIRDKVTSILSAHGDFKIMAQGEDAYDALRIVSNFKPDIAILDNHLGYIHGEEIPPLLRARSPSTAVVILTTKANDFQLYRAVRNEVSGLIHKETDMNSLPSILKCISDGGCFISPSLAAKILHIFAAHAPLKGSKEKVSLREDPVGYLSKTELQILVRMAEGNSSNEIAKSLHLKVGTVRNCISSVMHKTGLHNRSQLVHYALKYGLVPFA